MAKDFRILRVKRIAERALRAWEAGADEDQLSDFLEEIVGVCSLDEDEGGEGDEPGKEHQDSATAPPLA